MPCSFLARWAGEFVWWDSGTGVSPKPAPCLHHPWVPRDRAGPCPSTLYKPPPMSWGFEHQCRLCLDILLPPIFCFVFPPYTGHPERQMMSFLMTLATCHGVPPTSAVPPVLTPGSRTERFPVDWVACKPLRAGGRTHPAKLIQALWGREIWLQEQHRSPGSLIRSLAAAACACSGRSPAPCACPCV